MHRSSIRNVLFAVLATAAGCTSASYPSFGDTRSLLPGVAAGPIDAYLALDTALSPMPRAALVWLDPVSRTREASYERAGVLQGIRAKLVDAGLAHVYVVPTVPTRVREQSADDLDVDALRAAAARFQAEVLLLLQSETREGPEQNLLAITYLGLLPALFVPGDRADIKLATEVCAVHVRTGAALGCATGRASRGASLLWRRSADARRSAMREDALLAAVQEAASALRRDLDVHRVAR
jgi:hypothetical protein